MFKWEILLCLVILVFEVCRERDAMGRAAGSVSVSVDLETYCGWPEVKTAGQEQD